MIEIKDFEGLIYRVENNVATLTLNRPDVRNALSRRLYAEIESAFRHVQADPEVRCVILTGTDPAFCSGEDLRDMRAGGSNPDGLARMRQPRPEPTFAAIPILDCDRPIIAAVNGPAVGWGMELTLLADIRIASANARFSEIFIKRGLIADMAGMSRLPRIVGPQKAAELLFTGDMIDATEAARIGLVTKVVPHGELMTEARALAGRIAANAPLALRYTKEALRRAIYGDYRELGTWITGTYGVLFATEDHREGVASFLEKRAPVFKGK
jgi:enoyl-CoA hydratase/carnithine racemase